MARFAAPDSSLFPSVICNFHSTKSFPQTQSFLPLSHSPVLLSEVFQWKKTCHTHSPVFGFLPSWKSTVKKTYLAVGRSALCSTNKLYSQTQTTLNKGYILCFIDKFRLDWEIFVNIRCLIGIYLVYLILIDSPSTQFVIKPVNETHRFNVHVNDLVRPISLNSNPQPGKHHIQQKKNTLTTQPYFFQTVALNTYRNCISFLYFIDLPWYLRQHILI